MRYLYQFILQIYIFLSCYARDKMIHVFLRKKFVSVKNIRIFVAYIILIIIFKLKTMTMWKTFIKIILLMFVMCVDTHAQIRGARSDRKIVEIKKIVDLTRNQETAIRQAHDTYNRTVDSSLYNVDDPVLASEMKYRASKVFHESLMDVFTEKQRNRYIEVTSAPEVRMKADYKVGLLRESNKYSERELEAKRTAIYNYMMSEKNRP